MSYNSVQFVLFFAAYLILYLCMPAVWMRQAVILAGSLLFYLFAGGPDMLAVVAATSVIVYGASRCMDRVYSGYEKEKAELKPKERAKVFAAYKKRSKKYLVGAIVLAAGILVYTKGGRLLGWKQAENLKELLSFPAFLVPLGISYYTFSSIGYLLDVYWNKAKCEKNYFRLLTYMIYFPHIVQGPISRYDKLKKQFEKLPGFSYERVCFGLQRMLWGFFKKMVVADRIALFTGTVFAHPKRFGGVEIWIALLLCAVELYADFSGCMDIVLGASETMGIKLEENFRRPFFSKSAAEFWRRWHITLGAWFKDYIYMPIAMSPGFMKLTVSLRKKYGNHIGQNLAQALPLALVWLLTGLWHGTGKDYVFWGCYWGGIIILSGFMAPVFKRINEAFRIDTESFGFQLFRMVRTYGLFCFGRMLTVTGSLWGAKTLLINMAAQNKLWVLFDGSLYNHGLDRKNFYVALIGIVLMWAVDMLQEKIRIRETLAKQPLIFRWFIYYGAILALLIFAQYGPGYDATSFIYGGF